MTPPNPMMPGDHGIPPRRPPRSRLGSPWPAIAGVLIACLIAVPAGVVAVLAVIGVCVVVSVIAGALLWVGYSQGFQDGYRQHRIDRRTERWEGEKE